MIIQIALSAVCGFFAKLCDDTSDKNLPIAPAFAAIFAIIYGAGLGVLSALTPLSSLFIALAIANLLASKINSTYHIIGAAAFALAVVVMPMGYFDPWLFSLFLIAGLFDELEFKFSKVAKFASEQRLFVPAAAIAASIWSANIVYFAAIVAFDLAYRAAEYAVAKRYKK